MQAPLGLEENAFDAASIRIVLRGVTGVHSPGGDPWPALHTPPDAAKGLSVLISRTSLFVPREEALLEERYPLRRLFAGRRDRLIPETVLSQNPT